MNLIYGFGHKAIHPIRQLSILFSFANMNLHAADATMAIENARDVYTRRMEGNSIWVVESKYITASDPSAQDPFFDPAEDKIYRHPTFYELPEELTHM